MAEKKIELRNLKAKDLTPAITILRRIGFKEFKGCFESENVTKALGKLGEEGTKVDDIISSIGVNVVLDAIGIIIENYDKAEQDLYKFFSNLTGLTAEEVADLDLDVFFGLFYDLTKLPQFSNFFNRASKSIE